MRLTHATMSCTTVTPKSPKTKVKAKWIPL